MTKYNENKQEIGGRMKFSYNIINATEEEENSINLIISYIADNYNKKIDIEKLKQIEVVDKLDNNSSGRSIRDKIILPRKYGLEGIEEIKDLLSEKERNIKLKILIGTIYHELWHVSTWHKYEAMYEYVLDEENSEIFVAYAYMYWIEYIANIETVFIKVPERMREFCVNFVYTEWYKMEYGYSHFIKALPYYLIRSQYLNLFEDLTQKIECDELRKAVYDFDNTSKCLLNNTNIDDIKKADIIKNLIEELFA